MDRNRILRVALGACKIFKVLLLVFFAAYVVLFIHWHISPDAYEHVKIGDVVGKNTTSISLEKISLTASDISAPTGKPDAEKVFTWGNLNAVSFYLFSIQAISYLVLSFLITKEIQNIIQSVQKFYFFRIRNVDSFRKIGKYCFFLFLATAFIFAQTSEGNFLGIYFHFTPLFFMLASYILAEIFREGNKLYEEQQLTI